MTNIPVTFFCSEGDAIELYVGTTNYSTPPGNNDFKYTVLDLTNPTGPALVDESSNSNSEAPANVMALIGKPDTLLCFAFNNVDVGSIPTGNLYNFLIEVGANTQLRRVEQIVEQSGSNYVGGAGYLLITNLESNDAEGFEVLDLLSNPIMTIELIPIVVDGRPTYSPVMLS